MHRKRYLVDRHGRHPVQRPLRGRIAPGKHVLYKASRPAVLEIHGLGAQGDTDAATLASVPPLLDAIINEGHEAGRDHDTARMVSMLLLQIGLRGWQLTRRRRSWH